MMTKLQSPAPAATTAAPRQRGLRGDIQGLRAIAVAAVVVYHFAPGRLPGGYVGVDVFFVISGFLITSHLLREVGLTGTVRLRAFYARRIRRLLPAAVLVLGVTVAASFLLLPSSQLVETLRQATASAAYIENWVLAGAVVDYMAQDAAATPVQHYWSLSVEEQFYLLWPALILAVVWLVGRRRGRRTGPWLLGSLVVLGILSLVTSVVLTDVDRASAYFVTPTRIWEFVVGALLVFVPRFAVGDAARAVVAWIGVGLIASSAVTFSSASAFPGIIAAIPVLGTAAVIWGGEAATQRWMPGRWLGLRPFRFVGDSSYAIYLWHWPVLILLPYALGAAPSTVQRVIAVVGVVVVGWLSTRFFEAPVRAARWLNRGPSPWLLAVVSAAIFATLWGVTSAATNARSVEAADQARTMVGQPCYGAAALVEACDPVSGDLATIDPALAAADAQNPEYTRCDRRLDESELVVCGFGPDDAEVRLALVGDSHATQWLGALERIADDQGWHVETYLKSSCPLSASTRVLDGEPRDRLTKCLDWQEQVRAALGSADVDAVLVSAYARGYGWSSTTPGQDSDAAGVEGFVREWTALADEVAPVVVLADTPYLGGVNVPDCVAGSEPPFLDCSAPRDVAVVPDVMSAAVGEAGSADVRLLDLTDLFCDAERCLSAVGGEIIYRDSSHLTWNYAASAAPELARRLLELWDPASADEALQG